MHDIIRITFGGLSTQYYMRQLFFGLAITGFIVFTLIDSNKSIDLFMVSFLVVNTFLYPYSRFVYESIVEFVIGDNVFFMNAIFLLLVKMFAMIICWGFAVFIAPLGLLYLYLFHSKSTR